MVVCRRARFDVYHRAVYVYPRLFGHPHLVVGIHAGELLAVIFQFPVQTQNEFKGCAVGHIAPEAADGGPLAVVADGDAIEVDIPNAKLTLHVADEELQRRWTAWQPPAPKVKKGYLSIYAQSANTTEKGAALKYKLL